MAVRLLERDWKPSFRLVKTEHAPRHQIVRKTYFQERTRMSVRYKTKIA